MTATRWVRTLLAVVLAVGPISGCGSGKQVSSVAGAGTITV